MTISVFYNKCLELQKTLPNCRFTITTIRENTLVRVDVKAYYLGSPKSVIVSVDSSATEDQIDKAFKLLLL